MRIESATVKNLARAFVRWISVNGADALAVDEQRAWSSLAKAAKKALA